MHRLVGLPDIEHIRTSKVAVVAAVVSLAVQQVGCNTSGTRIHVLLWLRLSLQLHACASQGDPFSMIPTRIADSGMPVDASDAKNPPVETPGS